MEGNVVLAVAVFVVLWQRLLQLHHLYSAMPHIVAAQTESSRVLGNV